MTETSEEFVVAFASVFNDKSKVLAKPLVCWFFAIGAVACFGTESTAYKNEASDSAVSINFVESPRGIQNRVVLKEVSTLSVQSYWFGLSRVHSVDDKVSSLRIQRIRTPKTDTKTVKSTPSVVVVVGSKNAPHGVTGFELYFPKNEDFSWKVNKRTDESSGEYEISFYEDLENQANPEAAFILSIRRCNENFCAELLD